MKIFNFEITKSRPQQVVNRPDNKVDGIRDEVYSLSLQTSLPVIKEFNNKDYVPYGDDNDYPSYLEDLYNSSPTHQAIIDAKSLMDAGDGYEVNDTLLNDNQKLELYRMLSFIDGKHNVVEFLQIIAKHRELYGAIYLEIIWSMDFTKIVKVVPINPKHIRSGKYHNGDVKSWFYKRNWADRKEEYIEIPSFDINDKENNRQLLAVPTQLITNEYYGEPPYLASTNWIELESQTGLFYKSLIENGFNPSMVVKFYRKPANLSERKEIVDDLKRSFGGTKNTGKVMVMFSDGKELAPDVDPINTSNLDKQFLALAEQIQSKILTGARITTPELFGISTPGKLGNSDFGVQVEAFQKFVIKPTQIVLENIINQILMVNGLNVEFKIKPFEIDTTINKDNKTVI